ncbi:MAG: IS21-like element helper ATPase IstB [Bacteroidota bacterium]
MEQSIRYLRELKLLGMVNCIETQDILNQDLSFEEKFEFLLHHEITHKKNKKIARLLSNSQLRHNVRLEDIHDDSARGLDRSMLLKLLNLEFILKHENIIITGATGCGKTYLACAIGNKACIEGYSVKFIKLPTFLEEIQISHETGTFSQLLSKLMSFDVLILDDFGLTSVISDNQLNDLFNIIDERHQLKSTIITSQLATDVWHSYLNNPTLADAILDRLLSQADKIQLTGDSLRWTEKRKGGKKMA